MAVVGIYKDRHDSLCSGEFDNVDGSSCFFWCSFVVDYAANFVLQFVDFDVNC